MSCFTEVCAANDTLIPPYGKVDLLDKVSPVCERGDNIAPVWAYIRAEIDIKALKHKLHNYSDDVWESDSQSSNVKIVRPSHDQWGIKKIIFVFCDDFLQRVFDFPWIKDEEWRTLLNPIYKSVGTDESKVVRCLLASMGPGTSIPVHHDTGYWVKHTHRIHVPIETGPEVDFFVGPNDANMKKYAFDEGKVIELNNQAKHAVNNRMDRRRIHLIFDYVDQHTFSRITLQPGQSLCQTRRTIDLPSEAGSRKCPTFVIIGAQKSGTTSLYELMCQHPVVLRGKRRETHFFDWRWNAALTTPEAQLDFYLNFFEKAALHKYPSLCSGESTPSYLLHGDIVIPRMLSVCPWVKVLVILRDPVHRAYSQYQMCVDTKGTPEQLQVRGQSAYTGMTFEQVVESEIAALEAKGVNPDSSFELFKEQVLHGLPMQHGGHSIIARGLYALQLVPWREAFSEQQLMVLGSKEIQGDRQKVRETVRSVYDFVGLREHDVDDVSAKNTRDYSPMSETARERLTAFYAPYNKRLTALLGRELQW